MRWHSCAYMLHGVPTYVMATVYPRLETSLLHDDAKNSEDAGRGAFRTWYANSGTWNGPSLCVLELANVQPRDLAQAV